MQRELRNLWVTWLKFTVTKVSDDVGMEANIHWNGPPIHLAQNFGEAALDAHFGGRHKWHFVTRQDKKKKKDSVVLQRMEIDMAKLPFYN